MLINPEYMISTSAGVRPDPMIADILSKHSEQNLVRTMNFANARYLAVYAYSPFFDAVLSKYVPVNAVFAPLDKFKNWFLLLAALSVMIIVMYSLYAYKYIHKPLLYLVKATCSGAYLREACRVEQLLPIGGRQRLDVHMDGLPQLCKLIGRIFLRIADIMGQQNASGLQYPVIFGRAGLRWCTCCRLPPAPCSHCPAPPDPAASWWQPHRLGADAFFPAWQGNYGLPPSSSSNPHLLLRLDYNQQHLEGFNGLQGIGNIGRHEDALIVLQQELLTANRDLGLSGQDLNECITG